LLGGDDDNDDTRHSYDNNTINSDDGTSGSLGLSMHSYNAQHDRNSIIGNDHTSTALTSRYALCASHCV
jgi:hypothetical protein